MKNLFTLIAILSAFTWSVAYFGYHEGGFIHIFLGTAFLAALIRIIQETFYYKQRLAKRALLLVVR